MKLETITIKNRDLIIAAKARWYQDITTKIHNMSANTRTAWEYINILKGGDTTHHKSTINMAMRSPMDGSIATNAKGNINVFGPHFSKLLNSNKPIDETVLNLIPSRRKLRIFDNPITYKEVNKAINKLKRGKSPGLNGVPPEALKAMNPAMRREIHGFVSDFFKGTADY